MALKGIEDTWTDNGFSSLFAMRHSHDSILNAIGPIPLGKEGSWIWVVEMERNQANSRK
jgi:hypothetical protein